MLPSTTAVSIDLIFHVRRLYEAALESIARGMVRRKGINGFVDNALPAYIISVAAVEVFTNEFFLSPVAMTFLKDRWPASLSIEWFEKMELDRKLVVVPHILFGQTSDMTNHPIRICTNSLRYETN